MAKGGVRDQLEKRAARAILTRSIYRWESAAIIALTVVLTALVPQPLPFWQPWYWLVLGALGEVGLVWSSLRDPEFRARVVSDMFREKYRPRAIRDEALRAGVEKALEYRDSIFGAIDKGREGILRDYLGDVSRGVNDWVENVFRLAQRLDSYRANATIHRDLKAVEPEIDRLKRRLALAKDDLVKRQISQAIAQRQIQWDNLRKLDSVMERAQLQLESTLAAMGTVYSQVMILGARDVASGRAQRLQQDVTDQVQALQDVVQALDEVYRSGADGLGLGPEVDLAAITAAAGTARKGTGSGP